MMIRKELRGGCEDPEPYTTVRLLPLDRSLEVSSTVREKEQNGL